MSTAQFDIRVGKSKVKLLREPDAQATSKEEMMQ
jgi:hypothetical protein